MPTTNDGINYAHVDALLQAAGGGLVKVSVPDRFLNLTSQGHFVIDYRGSSEFEGIPHDNLLKIWDRAILDASRDHQIGKPSQLYIDSTRSKTYYYRRIGNTAIDERYFRIFPDRSRFFIPENKAHPIAVAFEGRLIGAAMPLSSLDNCTFAAEPISDEDVFRPSACDANGYYLFTDGRRISERRAKEEELRDLKKDRADCKSRLAELDSEIETMEREIEAIHAH